MFKCLNRFEKNILIIGLLLTLVLGIINHSELLSLINGLTNILNSILTSAGRVEAHYFALIGFSLYSVITVQNHLFSETLFTLIVCLPSTIIAIINWKKNLDNYGSVKPTKVTRKELIIAIVSQIFMAYPYYLLFKYFNTDHLVISTITICLNVLAIYFSTRASSVMYLFFICACLMRTSLWLFPLLEGDFTYVPTFISQIFYLIVDFYGLLKWKKKENENTCN